MNASELMSKSGYYVETRTHASEIKFLVDLDAASKIRAWARRVLPADPHGSGSDRDEYSTTSLYFDTLDFAVFHRAGSYRRSKYRIRRYGTSESVYLERKMRTGKVLSKRRTPVPCSELGKLAGGNVDQKWVGAWFQERLQIRRFAPAIQVSYHRTARVAETAHGIIRLTVDDNLRASPAVGLAVRPGFGETIIRDQAIIEMKFRVAMPGLFKDLAEQFALEPIRISKYRMAAIELGLVRQDKIEGNQDGRIAISCLPS
jgi:hypothetical protein